MHALLVVCLLATIAQAKTRTESAQALATIKPGMTSAEVKQRLGAPDDIRTERDPGGITAARTTEVWRYGTSHHLGFGTLGTVHIQADGKVQYVFGGAGTPLAMPEPELRRLLELIDAVPSYNARLDPRALIRAVDALQPLGKDRALAVIDEYLRVSSWLDDGGREGVFLLLRALFDAPVMPPMMVGGAPEPTDRKALPRFPLAIIDDVPIKLVSGYALGGEAERPEDDVAAFRTTGTMRAAPLAPSGAALDKIDAFVEGPLRRAMTVDDSLRILIWDQALRFTATVLRPADATFEAMFPYGDHLQDRWTARRAEVAKLAPRWDTTAVALVRADGTTVATPPTAAVLRVWWDLALPNTSRSRLTFERLDDTLVMIELRLTRATGKVRGGTIRLVDPRTGTTVTDFQFPSLDDGNEEAVTRRVRLARGQTIRPELDGTRGPQLRP